MGWRRKRNPASSLLRKVQVESAVEGTVWPFFADRQEGWRYGVLGRTWTRRVVWHIAGRWVNWRECLGKSLELPYKVDTHTACHQASFFVTRCHSGVSLRETPGQLVSPKTLLGIPLDTPKAHEQKPEFILGIAPLWSILWPSEWATLWRQLHSVLSMTIKKKTQNIGYRCFLKK